MTRAVDRPSLLVVKRRLLALIALAFVLAGPQGFAGWKHATLHGACGSPASRHGAPCDAPSGEAGADHSETSSSPASSAELQSSGCWICEALLVAPAALASPPDSRPAPIVVLCAATPADEPRAASLPSPGSPRAPPIS